MGIWVIGALINYLKEVLILKLNFQKNKVVTDKTPFFAIGQFCIPPTNSQDFVSASSCA